MQVLCVGKNYAKHAAELGGAVPDAPIWFWKPESAIVGDGEAIRLPAGVGAVHHEVELAVRVAAPGPAPGEAAAVDAFTVAIDVTARDLQTKAKAAGHPWAMAKGFDTFLPLGPWVDAAGVDLQDLQLRLWVDDDLRQDGWTGDMVWPVEELLRRAAAWVTLRPGDIVLAGTPEGVGPLRAGQQMRADVGGHASLTCPVKTRA